MLFTISEIEFWIYKWLDLWTGESNTNLNGKTYQTKNDLKGMYKPPAFYSRQYNHSSNRCQLRNGIHGTCCSKEVRASVLTDR